jgi:hypothetical protein
MKRLFVALALTVSITALAQQKAKFKAFDRSFDIVQSMPVEFNGTSYSVAYAIVATAKSVEAAKINNNQVRRAYAVNPCAEYNQIHTLAYDRGSVYANYPRPDTIGDARLAGEYAVMFSMAERELERVAAIAVINACATPNNKCCDKSGALDKCKDSTKFCELTGSIDNCTTSSESC